jgi:hypothetical protein
MSSIEEARGDADLPRLMCDVITRELPVDGAAISLIGDAMTRETVAAGDAEAALIEDLQFTLGEGPCYQAFADGAPVLVADVADIAARGRWPAFCDGLLQRSGVRAVFAFPLQVGAARVGVLDLYRVSPGTLMPSERAAAYLAADVVVSVILGVGAGFATAEGTPWADAGALHRTEVHLATGMIKAQLGISIEDAFARMRAYAFAHDLLIEEVAHDVVQRRLRLESE